MTKLCSVDGCHEAHSSKGYCTVHYARVRRTGKTETEQRLVGATLLERLWFRSEVVGECWVSHRAPTRRVREGNGGYPGIRIGERMVPVHQAGWIALRGPIPEGKELHHECSNKSCWRPEHLTPLTPQEHAAIHALEVCNKGHRLTPDNLYVRPNPPKGWSGRACKTCKAGYNRTRSERRSAERKARREAKAS
jgi:hypothetical protein